jgi:hypothetical protein
MFRWDRGQTLQFIANQSLEVCPFGEVQCHWVVGGLRQVLDDMCLNAGVESRGGNDFLKEACVYATRA